MSFKFSIKTLGVLFFSFFSALSWAYTICDDDGTYDKGTLDNIREKYCINDGDGSFSPQAAREFGGMQNSCVFSSCKIKLKAKLEMLSDKGFNVAYKNSATGSLVMSAAGKGYYEKASNIQIEAAKAVLHAEEGVQVPHDSGPEVKEAIKLAQRKSALETLIKKYKESKSPLPNDLETLIKRNDITDEQVTLAKQSFSNHIADKFKADTEKALATSAELQKKANGEKLLGELEKAKGVVSANLQELMEKKRSGAYDNAEILGNCMKNQPDLEKSFLEAKQAYEDLEQSQKELTDSMKEVQSSYNILMMAQSVFNDKYGPQGTKKVLEKVNESVLGRMMREIACEVKESDSCDSVLGANKAINNLYLPKENLQKYFGEDVQKQVKQK